tara:strand:+ start:129520 stop:129678 length:159 start_codon:yes stop_codon:yes gene_type:complete
MGGCLFQVVWQTALPGSANVGAKRLLPDYGYKCNADPDGNGNFREIAYGSRC